MIRKVILLAGCAALVAGCIPAPSAQMTEQMQAEVVGAVEEAVAGYHEAIMALDIERMHDFWADGEEIALAADGELIVGYDAFDAHVREALAGISSFESFEISNPTVHVLGPEAASLACEFAWSMTTSDGVAVRSHGSWMYVVKLLDGRWQAVHSAGTHVFEPEEPAEEAAESVGSGT